MKDWLKKTILKPIQQQLKQGISAEKLAWTIALGSVIAVFPILGTTTYLCIAVALFCKLNQVIIQVVNYALYPLQLLCIPLWIRLGEFLLGGAPASVAWSNMKDKLLTDSYNFLLQFWHLIIQALVGWLIVAPIFAFVVYKVLLLIFKLRRATRADA